jgi:hypothetical protein
MSRLQDWPSRLAAYVDAAYTQPFEWGRHDCSAFAAGAVEAMTGERPPLPAYADAREAAELLADESLSSRVRSILGPPIAPAFAQRGDLALVEIDGRVSLAVCVGDLFAGPGADGLVMVPRVDVRMAWRT